MTTSISATTALCGILLHPAGHTRSPAMHNAAFEALGIDASYLAFDVHPDDLEAALSGARALGVRQLAISLPHKIAVLDHLDEVDSVAQAIGAVNTVTFDGGRARGTNTDWLGAVEALEREAPIAQQHAVVLGAGGTARSVVYGLLQRGATVSVLNRTEARAEELAAELGAQQAGPLASLKSTAYDLLVNTTSVGLRSDRSPVAPSDLREQAVVLDAVYDPETTRLLRDAQAAGAATVQGKWMLVYQAAEQLRIWTGKEAPLEIMAAAFDRAGSD
uniref:Shikimate dehydrogenase (NADP(+)) n=1 Tax=uncultured myxobacterium HF0200_01L06 TaxID=723556 RepID=E7C3H9_9BACT|nr:shikimate 5-dehydrogenase [uncultured myxobacterium HF0200_01L06]